MSDPVSGQLLLVQLISPLPSQESDEFTHCINDLRRCKSEAGLKAWKRRYHESASAATSIATGSASAAAAAGDDDEPEPTSPTIPTSPQKGSAPASLSDAPFAGIKNVQTAAEVLRLFDSPAFYDGIEPKPVRSVGGMEEIGSGIGKARPFSWLTLSFLLLPQEKRSGDARCAAVCARRAGRCTDPLVAWFQQRGLG